MTCGLDTFTPKLRFDNAIFAVTTSHVVTYFYSAADALGFGKPRKRISYFAIIVRLYRDGSCLLTFDGLCA